MMRTTYQLQQEIQRLNRMICRIESKPQQEWATWSSTLRELREEREALRRLLLARRVESGKKVVSLLLWRDGPRAA